MKGTSEKSLDEMDLSEKTSWASGVVIVAIGEGKFRGAMTTVILAINREAYDRGVKAGVEQERERQKERDKRRKTRRGR